MGLFKLEQPRWLAPWMPAWAFLFCLAVAVAFWGLTLMFCILFLWSFSLAG